jgi:hypothetical protein
MKKLTAILLFAAILFAHIGPAAAQVMTYSYKGPAWNILGSGFCASYYHNGSDYSDCLNGSITASMTIDLTRTGLTGIVAQSQIISYVINAPGIGSISNDFTPGHFGASDLYVVNGQLVNWSLGYTKDTGTTRFNTILYYTDTVPLLSIMRTLKIFHQGLI